MDPTLRRFWAIWSMRISWVDPTKMWRLCTFWSKDWPRSTRRTVKHSPGLVVRSLSSSPCLRSSSSTVTSAMNSKRPWKANHSRILRNKVTHQWLDQPSTSLSLNQWQWQCKQVVYRQVVYRQVHLKERIVEPACNWAQTVCPTERGKEMRMQEAVNKNTPWRPSNNNISNNSNKSRCTMRCSSSKTRDRGGKAITTRVPGKRSMNRQWVWIDTTWTSRCKDRSSLLRAGACSAWWIRIGSRHKLWMRANNNSSSTSSRVRSRCSKLVTRACDHSSRASIISIISSSSNIITRRGITSLKKSSEWSTTRSLPASNRGHTCREVKFRPVWQRGNSLSRGERIGSHILIRLMSTPRWSSWRSWRPMQKMQWPRSRRGESIFAIRKETWKEVTLMNDSWPTWSIRTTRLNSSTWRCRNTCRGWQLQGTTRQVVQDQALIIKSHSKGQAKSKWIISERCSNKASNITSLKRHQSTRVLVASIRKLKAISYQSWWPPRTRWRIKMRMEKTTLRIMWALN